VILSSEKALLSGEVAVPASKSHTIRALTLATLARGKSAISNPLDSADTRSCVGACRALGAEIQAERETWTVQGTAGRLRVAENVIDVQNSGTTLYIALGMAALVDGWNVLTGDAQTRRRTAQNLIAALNALGARVESMLGNGCAPILVHGPLRGGQARIACPTSQYLTSLLIAAPLARLDTTVVATQLNEEPYVLMTLDWLRKLNVKVAHRELREFSIPGQQEYSKFEERIQGDFSSATFFLCAAALSGSDITLRGLDMDDAQGDKEVVNMLRKMGAEAQALPGASGGQAGAVRIRGGKTLKGVELDLNATPDALPALAITACFAEGTTKLLNVPQARIKETDRIRVMCEVVNALGGKAEELPDGLVVHGTGLRGGQAHGHADHRVVMACAIAGLAAERPVEVDAAEAVSVTFPSFVELMTRCGARMKVTA
jgi:3-phosphoshikimate 1-carboxyvinyltransferase